MIELEADACASAKPSSPIPASPNAAESVDTVAVPLAGVGAVEVLLPFALVWVGYSLPAAVLAVFAYRIFNLWLPLGPAAVGLYHLRQRAPEPPEPSAADAEVGGDEDGVRPAVDALSVGDDDG